MYALAIAIISKDSIRFLSVKYEGFRDIMV